VRRGDDTEPLLYPGIPHGALDLPGNGDQLVTLPGFYRHVYYLHTDLLLLTRADSNNS
jgi:hypothetical protein